MHYLRTGNALAQRGESYQGTGRIIGIGHRTRQIAPAPTTRTCAGEGMGIGEGVGTQLAIQITTVCARQIVG